MKKYLFPLFLAAFCLAVFGEVKTDYNHSTDFGKYKTYSWIKVQAGNSLWQDRIMQDVDGQLAARGWTKVESGGDTSVAAVGSTHTEQRCKLSTSRWGVVLAGIRYGHYDGCKYPGRQPGRRYL